MPLSSDLLIKRWSTVELPILPFLAPRVFTPWPSTSRRAHTGAQFVQNPDTNEHNHKSPHLRLEEEEQGRKKQKFLLRRLAAKDAKTPKQQAKKTADEGRKTSDNAWGDFSNFYDARWGTPKASTEASPRPSFDDEFRRKYENIWGIGQMHSLDTPRPKAKKRENSEKVSAPEKSDQFRVVKLVPGVRRVRGTRRVNEARKAWLQNRHGATCHHQEEEGTGKYWSHRKARGAINRCLVFRKTPAHWKFVRWTPRQARSPILAWKKRIALLHMRQNGVVDGQGRPKLVTSRKRMADLAFREALMKKDSSTSLREVWEALPLRKRRDIWSELMLSTLDEHPTKALQFLEATYIHPYPPGYAVGNSFDYIVSYYLRNRTARNPKNALEIFRIFVHIQRLGPPRHFYLRQSSVYLLLKNLDDAFVGILFQVLKDYDHKLHKHTLMHFPKQLRLSGGTDERIEVLQKLWREGSDFNSPEVISVCVTLLQLKNRSSEVTYSDSEIFEFMLECGMMPNIVIYNVLLQNSLEAGDHETGWQIHDMMIENGIETDAYTYSLLLSDAKLRNDRHSIERVINLVSEKGIRNAHIVTDLLHSIFLFRGNYGASSAQEQRGRPSKTFERMLLVYRQYFHLEPLACLIPWLEESYPSTTPVSKETLMDAPVPTLVVMLTAFFRQLSAPGPALHFYNHFCNLLQVGDPVATALSKSTHIYNIILKALGNFQQTLAVCPRLIGDMLSQKIVATSETPDAQPRADGDESQSSPQVCGTVHDDSEGQNTSAQNQSLLETSSGSTSTEQLSENVQADPISATPSSSGQRGLHPKPDVNTWSVLLKAFMDQGQPRAAEKVLTMMKDRSVWPNQVTWNSLIIGYARMQDMSMTVDAVNRLQRAGFALDAVSMKGLAYFQNRRALIEAMKASEASDPGRSIKKRPVAIGLAKTALNRTLRMVRKGSEGDGLEPVTEAADDTGETLFREHEDILSMGCTGREERFVVKDVPLVQDEVDLDR